MTATRQLQVRFHDAAIGVWQDDANDPTFRTDVFAEIIRHMRRRRWTVGADPDCHHRSLRLSYRLARRGDFRVAISVCGRHIELKFWTESGLGDNRNGRRYDFDQFKRFSFLDRMRFLLERHRLLEMLRLRSEVEVVESRQAAIGPGGETAMQFIQRRWSQSWHKDKELGRPVCQSDYNRKSGDGELVEHGATVWYTDRKGRIRRGTALYNINNMWWVTAGRYELHNLGSHEIFCRQPADLRRKRNEGERRGRLERELERATRAMNFQRAELIRHILFGDGKVFLIWARDHKAYYRANYSGYTTDVLSAGKYLREEAEREVRRVPDELVAVDGEGRHVDFGVAA